MHNEKPVGWTAISSRPVAECRVFNVREDDCVRDQDGARSTFFIIENPDWVNVTAITKNNEILLIRQFRHGSGTVVTEIPGGMVDDGEEPLEAAKRELREETGYSSEKWIAAGTTLPNPALQNNSIHHFIAFDAELTSPVDLDEHEDIEVMLFPLRELREFVQNGGIEHSLAITALYFLDRYLKDENIAS